MFDDLSLETKFTNLNKSSSSLINLFVIIMRNITITIFNSQSNTNNISTFYDVRKKLE